MASVTLIWMVDVDASPVRRAGCLASMTWATTGVTAFAINIVYAFFRYFADPTPLWPTLAAVMLLVVGVTAVVITADHPRAWVASTVYLIAVLAGGVLLLIPGRVFEDWFGH